MISIDREGRNRVQSARAAERDLHERTLADVHAHLDDQAFAAAWAEGRAMSLPEAVAYARAEPPKGPPA
jgi:hypothetical protein